MKRIITFWSSCLLLLLLSTVTSAQNRQFSVASFALDQFDLTARNDQHMKIDGNGSVYAIIKVTSNNPEDKLSEYRFNFGNMNHEVVNRDGELWVYVQRNAKYVTISRQGFTTINKYDLGLTIEEGRTYTMKLSPAPLKIDYQMVMFAVKPADNKGMVSVKSAVGDGTEEMIRLSETEGTAAKNLPFGTYTYKVMAEGFYPSEGSFTLNNVAQTHTENVILKAKYATVTLNVEADADIFVNGEKKGRRTWTGRLNGGAYQVECRQERHRPTMQNITVVENVNKTFSLTAPTPIIGTLSVISEPLGATIAIDGVKKGTTPCNITDVLIGKHSVVISKDGYEQTNQTFDITEGQTTNLNIALKKNEAGTTNPSGQDREPLMGGLSKMTTPPTPLNKSFKYDYKDVCFKCKAKHGYVTITGFDVNAHEVVIPSKVQYGGQYYPVKEVDVFINGNNYSATKLAIEEGVEVIANFAFIEFRRLTEVTLPKSIKAIGKNAFRKNSGMQFHLPPTINEFHLKDGHAVQL